jgi:hypothetical protein
MNSRLGRFAIVICFFVLIGQGRVHAGYHLERVTPVLNQPTYVTQASGDPPNIIYYSTRINGNASGFNTNNPMGSIWRYNLITRSSTEVLNLSTHTVFNDDGLQTFAFHPDFNVQGAAAHGKIYVAFSEKGTTSINHVEEFTILDPFGSLLSSNQIFATERQILRYNNSSQNNHTVDWVGFDPNATGPARNYLYISTGDGSFGNNYNNGSPVNGRPSQNTNDVKGKILRIDISGADDYPSNTNKNFAIPPSNPIPAYNSVPGQTNAGLGELYVTGVRNPYRVSFDRANSDMYWGDVGENTYEEVDFLKAGVNNTGLLPVDYGWPQLEATNNGVSTAPHTTTNPFTGVISFYPIQAYTHATGQAAIGGYVYHGPIPELQGKYFYADFVAGRVWMLNFDRNTDPATFKGTNGVLANVTTLWNSRIIDTNVPGYRGDTSLATMNGLDHIVSFGEDNAGNVYLVDFGFGTTFDGQYTANAGEIFKLVADPTLNWTNTGSSVNFTWVPGYKLQSQTNSLVQGISTNWSDYPGGTNGPITVSLDTALDAVFYRLIAK